MYCILCMKTGHNGYESGWHTAQLTQVYMTWCHGATILYHCCVQIAVTEDTHYTRHQIENEICRLIIVIPLASRLMLRNVTYPKLIRKGNVKHSALTTNSSPFGTNLTIGYESENCKQTPQPMQKMCHSLNHLGYYITIFIYLISWSLVILEGPLCEQSFIFWGEYKDIYN